MTNLNSTSLKTSFSREGISELAKYVQTKLTGHINPTYVVFNWDHTLDLIDTSKKVSKKEKVSDEDQRFIEAALFFSNLGFVSEKNEPLKKSAEMARDYMMRRGFADKLIQEISDAVEKLESLEEPKNHRVGIARDVRTASYGQKKLLKKLSRNYEEYKMVNEESTDEVKWMDNMIESLVNHKYNTSTARKYWRKRKRKNIKKLKSFVFKLKRNSSLSYNKKAMTMFKTASRNQIDLVNIADKKAGIMITVNAILITIMLPLFASYIIDMSRYIVPSMILMITCGISIILATLATKPAPTKDPSKAEFESGDKSLFYFRNFVKLNKEDYKTAIHNLIVRDSSFENAVMTDLYDLGTTLDLKYRKLTWCYWVFAIGIGLTIVTFLASFVLFGGF